MGRMIDIPMPKLGLTMSEGTISEWLVRPGEALEVGQPIAVIETDKIANEIEASEPGILSERLFEEGAVVEVGVVIARLSTDGEGVAQAAAPPLDRSSPSPIDARPASPPLGGEPAAVGESAIRPPPQARHQDHRMISTPYARKLASGAGIDINSIRPAAGEHRITALTIEDLIAARGDIAPTGPDGGRMATAPATLMPCVLRTAIIQQHLDILPLIDVLQQLRHRLTPEKRFDIGHALAFAAARALSERQELGIIAGQRPERITIQNGFAAPHGSISLDRVSGLALSAFVTLIEGARVNEVGAGPELIVRDLSAVGQSCSSTTALPSSAILSISCGEARFIPDSNRNPMIENRSTITVFSSFARSEKTISDFLQEVTKYVANPFILLS